MARFKIQTPVDYMDVRGTMVSVQYIESGMKFMITALARIASTQETVLYE